MSLRDSPSAHWRVIQGELLPLLDDAVGPLTPMHRQLATVLVARVEHRDAPSRTAPAVPWPNVQPWRGPSWPRRCSTTSRRAR